MAWLSPFKKKLLLRGAGAAGAMGTLAVVSAACAQGSALEGLFNVVANWFGDEARDHYKQVGDSRFNHDLQKALAHALLKTLQGDAERPGPLLRELRDSALDSRHLPAIFAIWCQRISLALAPETPIAQLDTLFPPAASEAELLQLARTGDRSPEQLWQLFYDSSLGTALTASNRLEACGGAELLRALVPPALARTFPAQFAATLKDSDFQRSLIAYQKSTLEQISDTLGNLDAESRRQLSQVLDYLERMDAGHRQLLRLGNDTVSSLRGLEPMVIETLEQTRRLAAYTRPRARSPWYVPPPSPKRQSGVRALRFNERVLSRTVGRERALAELESFLDAPDQLLWWAVIGVAGMGKSHLALTLIEQRVAKGWDAGFLESSTRWLDDEGTQRAWIPEAPTLIVIDYAAARVSQITRAIVTLWECRQQFPHPVRILLLDRPGGLGPAFAELMDRQNMRGDDRVRAMSALYSPPITSTSTAAGAAPAQFLELQSLPRTEWREFLEGALRTWLDPRPLPADDDPLWGQIDKLSDHGRPLLLLVVGSLLADPNAALADPFILDDATRREMLAEILRRETEVIWPEASGISKNDWQESLRLSFIRGVTFITLLRGLDMARPVEREALLRVMEIPTQRKAITRDQLRSILGVETGRNDQSANHLRPLEPDLFGEFLLAWSVTPDDMGDPPLEIRDILIEAISVDPRRTSEFLILAARDFPREATVWLQAALRACETLPAANHDLTEEATLQNSALVWLIGAHGPLCGPRTQMSALGVDDVLRRLAARTATDRYAITLGMLALAELVPPAERPGVRQWMSILVPAASTAELLLHVQSAAAAVVEQAVVGRIQEMDEWGVRLLAMVEAVPESLSAVARHCLIQAELCATLACQRLQHVGFAERWAGLLLDTASSAAAQEDAALQLRIAQFTLRAIYLPAAEGAAVWRRHAEPVWRALLAHTARGGLLRACPEIGAVILRCAIRAIEAQGFHEAHSPLDLDFWSGLLEIVRAGCDLTGDMAQLLLRATVDGLCLQVARGAPSELLEPWLRAIEAMPLTCISTAEMGLKLQLFGLAAAVARALPFGADHARLAHWDQLLRNILPRAGEPLTHPIDLALSASSMILAMARAGATAEMLRWNGLLLDLAQSAEDSSIGEVQALAAEGVTVVADFLLDEPAPGAHDEPVRQMLTLTPHTRRLNHAAAASLARAAETATRRLLRSPDQSIMELDWWLLQLDCAAAASTGPTRAQTHQRIGNFILRIQEQLPSDPGDTKVQWRRVLARLQLEGKTDADLPLFRFVLDAALQAMQSPFDDGWLGEVKAWRRVLETWPKRFEALYRARGNHATGMAALRRTLLQLAAFGEFDEARLFGKLMLRTAPAASGDATREWQGLVLLTCIDMVGACTHQERVVELEWWAECAVKMKALDVAASALQVPLLTLLAMVVRHFDDRGDWERGDQWHALLRRQLLIQIGRSSSRTQVFLFERIDEARRSGAVRHTQRLSDLAEELMEFWTRAGDPQLPMLTRSHYAHQLRADIELLQTFIRSGDLPADNRQALEHIERSTAQAQTMAQLWHCLGEWIDLVIAHCQRAALILEPPLGERILGQAQRAFSRHLRAADVWVHDVERWRQRVGAVLELLPADASRPSTAEGLALQVILMALDLLASADLERGGWHALLFRLLHRGLEGSESEAAALVREAAAAIDSSARSGQAAQVLQWCEALQAIRWRPFMRWSESAQGTIIDALVRAVHALAGASDLRGMELVASMIMTRPQGYLPPPRSRAAVLGMIECVLAACAVARDTATMQRWGELGCAFALLPPVDGNAEHPLVAALLEKICSALQLWRPEDAAPWWQRLQSHMLKTPVALLARMSGCLLEWIAQHADAGHADTVERYSGMLREFGERAESQDDGAVQLAVAEDTLRQMEASAARGLVEDMESHGARLMDIVDSEAGATERLIGMVGIKACRIAVRTYRQLGLRDDWQRWSAIHSSIVLPQPPALEWFEPTQPAAAAGEPAPPVAAIHPSSAIRSQLIWAIAQISKVNGWTPLTALGQQLRRLGVDFSIFGGGKLTAFVARFPDLLELRVEGIDPHTAVRYVRLRLSDGSRPAPHELEQLADLATSPVAQESVSVARTLVETAWPRPLATGDVMADTRALLLCAVGRAGQVDGWTPLAAVGQELQLLGAESAGGRLSRMLGKFPDLFALRSDFSANPQAPVWFVRLRFDEVEDQIIAERPPPHSTPVLNAAELRRRAQELHGWTDAEFGRGEPLLELAFKACAQQDAGGWTQLAKIGNKLRELIPGFDVRALGFKTLGKWAESLPDLIELRREPSKTAKVEVVFGRWRG